MDFPYGANAESRLPEQFTASPLLHGLVRVLVEGFTAVDHDLDTLTSQRTIDTASGALLDLLGQLLGTPRGLQTDEAYRQTLKFQQLRLRADGTPEKLQAALRFLTDPSDAQYFEQYPASVFVYTNGVTHIQGVAQAIGPFLPVAVENLNVAVSYASPPFRLGTANSSGDLYVNNQLLQVNNQDLSVVLSEASASSDDARLGGVVPGELYIDGLGYLDVGGNYLSTYNPNSAAVIGDNFLPGVLHE